MKRFCLTLGQIFWKSYFHQVMSTCVTQFHATLHAAGSAQYHYFTLWSLVSKLWQVIVVIIQWSRMWLYVINCSIFFKLKDSDLGIHSQCILILQSVRALILIFYLTCSRVSTISALYTYFSLSCCSDLRVGGSAEIRTLFRFLKYGHKNGPSLIASPSRYNI